MANVITRRSALAASAALASVPASAQGIRAADVQAPRLPIESGATLRVIRPARFVEPDEVIMRRNIERFTQQTGVQVRMDLVGWEDLRPQTAVTANTQAGPDVIIGWQEDPQIFADRLVEVTDIAEYLGQRYGGWMFLGERFGKRSGTNNWISIPIGGSGGPMVYRASAVREAGFNAIPNDHDGFLRLCQGLRRINKPAGFALGNAVGDGNAFANWLVWSFGGRLTDEQGRVTINSAETRRGLEYLRELYATFIPGTLAWGDPSNNRAFAAQEVWLTQNGVSLYYALKNDRATAALAEDTDHAPMVQGRAASTPLSALTPCAMVMRHTRFPNASKELIRFLMEREQYEPWLTGCLGYWAHPLRAYGDAAVWKSDPKLAIYQNTLDNRFWNGFAAPPSQATGAATAEYVMVQMCASVASGQATPEAAAREAERRARRFFRNT